MVSKPIFKHQCSWCNYVWKVEESRSRCPHCNEFHEIRLGVTAARLDEDHPMFKGGIVEWKSSTPSGDAHE